MDITSGKILRALATHKKAGIRCMALCPDGRRVVTGGQDGEIRLSDLSTGELIASAIVGGPYAPVSGSPTFQCPVTSVVIPPDGKLVITGSEDTRIRAWELPA